MIDSLRALLTRLMNLRRSQQIILLIALGSSCLMAWCCLAATIIGGLSETTTSPTEVAVPLETMPKATPEATSMLEVVPEATLPPTPAPEATPTPTVTPEVTQPPTPTPTSTLPPTPAPITAIVNVETLNLRDGPGTEYGIVSKLQQGTVTTVIGQNSEGDWLKVQLGQVVGWVAKEYVETPAEAATVPVVEAPPVPTAIPTTDTPLPPTPLPPTPPPAATSPPPVAPTAIPEQICDPAYPDVCIPPPPPDLDCKHVPYRRFRVFPPDPHGFDGDNDGIGCEQ